MSQVSKRVMMKMSLLTMMLSLMKTSWIWQRLFHLLLNQSFLSKNPQLKMGALQNRKDHTMGGLLPSVHTVEATYQADQPDRMSLMMMIKNSLAHLWMIVLSWPEKTKKESDNSWRSMLFYAEKRSVVGDDLLLMMYLMLKLIVLTWLWRINFFASSSSSHRHPLHIIIIIIFYVIFIFIFINIIIIIIIIEMYGHVYTI